LKLSFLFVIFLTSTANVYKYYGPQITLLDSM
jgi:hypothetical protein